MGSFVIHNLINALERRQETPLSAKLLLTFVDTCLLTKVVSEWALQVTVLLTFSFFLLETGSFLLKLKSPAQCSLMTFRIVSVTRVLLLAFTINSC